MIKFIKKIISESDCLFLRRQLYKKRLYFYVFFHDIKSFNQYLFVLIIIENENEFEF